MNRGVARRQIFDNDDQRNRFLGCVSVASSSYGIEIHGYCLLGNHYHLLIRSGDGRLSEAMQWIGGRYTQSINYDKGRDGPLFRGRFAAVQIEDDAHLMQALRYIHLNPLSAGLVSAIENWPWSSAAAYAGAAPCPKWLWTANLLELFGPDRPLDKYREFVCDGIELSAQRHYEKFLIEHGVRPAGSDPGES